MKKQDKLTYILKILDTKSYKLQRKLDDYEWRKKFDNTLSNSHLNRILKKISELRDALDSFEYVIRILIVELSNENYLEKMKSEV